MVTLSYSTIKLLRTNPSEYRRIYILGGPRNKENDRQLEGMLLHDLILSPTIVNDKYVVVDKRPKSEKMLKYLDRLSMLIDSQLSFVGSVSETDINSFRQTAYNDSGYEEAIEEVEEKSKAFDSYYKYCLMKKIKHAITTAQKEHVQSLISHKILQSLGIIEDQKRSPIGTSRLYTGSCPPERELCIISPGYELYWEFPFTVAYSLNSKTTGKRAVITIQGSMDHVYINHNDKTVIIKDLKKVDTLLEVEKSFRARHWDLQAGVYCLAMDCILKKLELNYTIFFEFIAVDDDKRAQTFVFSSKSLEDAVKKAEEDIDMAYWNVVSKSYDLPYEYRNPIIL